MPSTRPKTQSGRQAGTKVRARARRKSGKVRYAVVGLGWIAQSAILPAFAHAKRNSQLVALVSDDARKAKVLAQKYGVDFTGGYEAFEEVLMDAGVEAVFLALPNHMHRAFTERAATLGIHVLCEKPMATSVADCEAMLAAVQAADVRLMIAYRLHFEPANLEAIEIARSRKLGDLRLFESVFSTPVTDADNIRLDSSRGGGTLWDLGVYCINAARGLFRAEPEEVQCRTVHGSNPRFADVEEMSSAWLRFSDDRVAQFTVSFGGADVSGYRLVGTKGDVRLSRAYEIKDKVVRELTIDGKTRKRTFPKRDQFAPEILHFSECVRTGREPGPSGLEGLADVRVVEALYAAARTNRSVELPPVAPVRRVVEPPPQQPPVGNTKVVRAKNPSP